MALGRMLLVSLALVFLAGLTFVRHRGVVFAGGVAVACSAVAALLTRDGFLVLCAGALPLCALLVVKSIFDTFGTVEAARRPRRRPPSRASDRRRDDSQIAA
jgi:hypothetical protein